MARPLRIEFPGAVYHVTTRGNAREAIFRTNADREALLYTLADVVARFHWRCHAYCLMSNHYHLLVETLHANLSTGMRHLNGIYTQRFNRRHDHVGHVFQGRFKSILVERHGYLLELARYIVLNPVRAGTVADAASYRWSSYACTAGRRAAPAWLTTQWILGQFSSDPATARERYVRFVASGKDASSPWPSLRGQVLLGSDPFVASIRQMLEIRSDSAEVPRSQRLSHRPALKALLSPRVLADKRARDHALRRACLDYGYTLAAVGRHAGLHYSTVSKVIAGER